MNNHGAIIENGNSEQNKAEQALQQFLTFNIGSEEYAVGLMSVREIKGWTQTTRLPNSPDFMKGVINLRGVVIPIFDLRKRFSMGDTEPHEKNAVIILSVGDRLIGILVDAVSDILSTNASNIRPAPHVESKIDTNFVSGLIEREEKMVVLLDVEKIFDTTTLTYANNSGDKAE
jgi:purine-binding chemotaxis protein CheW